MRFIQWIKRLFARKAQPNSRIDYEDLQRGSDWGKLDDAPAVQRKSNARYMHTVEGHKVAHRPQQTWPASRNDRNLDQCQRRARAACGGQRVHCAVCGVAQCPRLRAEAKAQQSWMSNPPPAPASMQPADEYKDMVRTFTRMTNDEHAPEPQRFESGGASGSWEYGSSSSDSSSSDSSSSCDSSSGDSSCSSSD